MKKSELFKEYKDSIATGDKIECVVLSIHMPTGEIENIVNPNVPEKMKYIDKTYDDNLVHKNCKDIYITDCICVLEGDKDLAETIQAIEECGYHNEGERLVDNSDWLDLKHYLDIDDKIGGN